MNGNQNIQPGIESGVVGEPQGKNSLVRIRRKLALTFVLSNPFRVPVAQSPATPASPEADSAREAEQETI